MNLGFPEEKIVKSWLNESVLAAYPDERPVDICEIKNSEIPILKNYEGTADDSFWEQFPKRDIPVNASTRVDIEAFSKHVEENMSKMTLSELRRAKRVLEDLSIGASAFQKTDLPPLSTRCVRSKTGRFNLHASR